MKLRRICLNINGADRFIVCDSEQDSLADVLRRMGLTGTKVGCGIGVCGSCSVLFNGEVIRSCTRKMKNVPENSKIVTIEGIGTPNYLHPLQQAWITYGGVQCGFCSPGFIVSAKGLLDRNPNPTRDDVRAWFQKHRNACRCTGYKPIVDAVMEAAKVLRGEKTMEDITYQYPPDKKFYGTGVPRPAALAKVCGTCDYGDDLKFKMPPGTLHLAIVQPKAAFHAKILAIDFSEAEKMPGVVKVITAKDIKGTNLIENTLLHKRSRGRRGPNRPIIADKKIFRYGDVVAVVAADTEANAREAAKAVKVKFEKLPEYTSVLDAVVPDAMEIHEGVPNIYMVQPLFKGEGDTGEIIENSAYWVEGSFSTTREPHLSIEGDSVQAYWGDDGMLTVQCKAQSIERTRIQMASAIGIEYDKIRVIENPTGGSFGWATSAGSYALAAASAVILDQPVTLTLSYEEHHHFSGKRSPAYFNARMACDEQGKITAYEFETAVDHGAYCENTDILIEKFIRFNGFPYTIPNVRALARMVYTNHAFAIAYRGFGSPQSYTCSESMIDMLAEKAGIDPFEFRYINIARPGDTTVNSYLYKEYPMAQIFDKMRPLYREAVARAKAADTPEKRRGVGIACGGYNVSGGGGDHASIALELNSDGTFTHYNTWEDQGQGGDVGAVMHVCEALKELGVTPAQVKLVMNDSKTCPDTGIAASSRCHYMAGNATITAAKQLLDAMRKPDGTYRTHAEMVAEGIPTKYTVKHSNSGLGLVPISPNDGKGDPSPTLMYALFMSEVEVDVKTGKTTVLAYTAVDDVGVIGNRISVEGQAYGGISHTIGFALSENYEDVTKNTNILNSGIPYIMDIPDKMDLYHLENPRTTGPFGSSGCSEVFQSGGHMSVINAIHNATGVRIYELPATPAKVKEAIEALARGEELKPRKYFLGSDMHEELEEIKANPV
jgi:aldehyde oxidoreductase